LILDGTQRELLRHRDIILAAIDYSLEKSNSTIKIDGRDPSEPRYLRLKQSAEIKFQKGKLGALQKMLDKLLEDPLDRADLSFNRFIKNKTGYDINIFENIKERTETIIKRNRIKNEKELHDIVRMLNILGQEAKDKSKIDILRNLSRDFTQQQNKDKDAIERSQIPKELFAVYSPNKKFRLSILEQEQNGEFGTTTIFVNAKYAGASLYDIQGINLNIKAYWENDNTIIIETKKKFKSLSQHKQIQFNEDIIDVKFIEN